MLAAKPATMYPVERTVRSFSHSIRATVRATDPSALALPMAAVRVSRVNQATRRSFSIAAWARASAKWLLPVPEGPAMTRFSARLTDASHQLSLVLGAPLPREVGAPRIISLPSAETALPEPPSI